MARLGDVCDILNGFAFKSEQYVEEGIRIIRIANVQKGYIEDSTPVFYPIDNKDAKKYSLEEDDMLMSLTGNVGRVAKLSKEFLPAALNQRVACLRIKDGVALDKAFLFNLLNSDYFEQQCIAASKGVAQKNMSTEWLKEYEIPMFSLEQQKKIASVLDKVTELIALRKEQLAKLEQLVKSQFIELFGATGKQVPLTDYVWFQEGPGVRSVDFTEDGTILLTGSNINDNEISFGHKSDRHISNELASGKYAHFMCDRDDILVVSSAIDPDKFDKKVVVVDTDKKYCLNTGIIRFKPNKQHLTLGYFREFLKTDYFKHQVSSEMRGIAQMHFGPSHLKQMTILLPNSIESQIVFEEFVQQTDKSKLAIQASLEKLETLKKALMQEYFG